MISQRRLDFIHTCIWYRYYVLLMHVKEHLTPFSKHRQLLSGRTCYRLMHTPQHTCRWGCAHVKLSEHGYTFLFKFGQHGTVKYTLALYQNVACVSIFKINFVCLWYYRSEMNQSILFMLGIVSDKQS